MDHLSNPTSYPNCGNKKIQNIVMRELLHLGYEVFIPVGGGLTIVTTHSGEARASRSIIRSANKALDPAAKRNSPSVRITNIPKGTNYLIAVYGQDVWMIPVVDIPNSKQIIRLGKRYDEYMITQPKISQQQFDLISDEDAKNKAENTALEKATEGEYDVGLGYCPSAIPQPPRKG